VFDVASGRPVFGPVHTPFLAGDVALDAHGRTVAITGGLNGDLATYSVDSGRLRGRLPGLPRPREAQNWRDNGAVTFAGKGRVFLGSLAGPVREVDARTLRVQRTFATPPMSSHNYVSLTPDGMLVTAGDAALTGVDVATGELRWDVDLTEDPDVWPCGGFAVAAEVGRFYCASQFGEVVERDLATGQLTGRHLDSQHGEVVDLAVAHYDELVTFVSGYARWRLDGSGPVSRLASEGVAVDGYDDSGQLLPVLDPDSDRVSVMDAEDGTKLGTLRPGETPAWLGGRSMLVFSDDRPLELLDVGTRHRTTVDVDAWYSNWVKRDLTGSGLAWVTVDRDGLDATPEVDVVEVDARTGALSGRRTPLPGFPDSVVPAADGESLWVAYYRFAPGGQISWRDNHARAEFARLDIDTGRVVTGIHDARLAAVSNRGRVVTADYDGNIEERDPETLKPIKTLAGSRGLLEQLAFTSDGQMLIATGDEGTVQLYDTSSWTRLAEIPSAAPDGFYEGWLSPDGEAVAVNTETGVVEWTLDPDRLARAACELASRNMSHAEWKTYMPDQPYRRTCPDYPPEA
jgi:WD40 repeat protein